nr:hypothetical protein GCM10020092_046120 [Actinoplanes digitatis]
MPPAGWLVSLFSSSVKASSFLRACFCGAVSIGSSACASLSASAATVCSLGHGPDGDLGGRRVRDAGMAEVGALLDPGGDGLVDERAERVGRDGHHLDVGQGRPGIDGRYRAVEDHPAIGIDADLRHPVERACPDRRSHRFVPP